MRPTAFRTSLQQPSAAPDADTAAQELEQQLDDVKGRSGKKEITEFVSVGASQPSLRLPLPGKARPQDAQLGGTSRRAAPAR